MPIKTCINKYLLAAPNHHQGQHHSMENMARNDAPYFPLKRENKAIPKVPLKKENTAVLKKMAGND